MDDCEYFPAEVFWCKTFLRPQLVYCQARAYSYSTPILAHVNNSWLKISQKIMTFFSFWMFFFLKQSSFLLLWLLLIFVSLAVSTVALFTGVFTELVYDALAPWKKKKIRTIVIYFCFVSFVLNVIVFVYKGLKQSLIQQTKPNRLLQISFFLRILRFILK